MRDDVQPLCSGESVAQLVEHRPFKARVLGSNPSRLTTSMTYDFCHFHRTTIRRKILPFSGETDIFQGEGPYRGRDGRLRPQNSQGLIWMEQGPKHEWRSPCVSLRVFEEVHVPYAWSEHPRGP